MSLLLRQLFVANFRLYPRYLQQKQKSGEISAFLYLDKLRIKLQQYFQLVGLSDLFRW